VELKKHVANIASFVVKQSSKIRTKLFVTYFIIIILIIAGIGTTSYYFSSTSIETKLMDANKEITKQIHKNLESNFQQIKNIMLIPYNNSDFITGVDVYGDMTEVDKAVFQRKMNDYFVRSFYNMHQSDLENFYLYSKDGSILYSSSMSGISAAEADFKNGSWVKKTMSKNGGTYFSSAHLVNGEILPVFSTSMMIKNISNDNDYSYVKADFNFDEIADICNSKILGRNSETLLLDEDGKVVYSSGTRATGSAFDKAVLSKMGNASDSFWIQTLEGRYMVSYAKSGISGWNIVSMLSEDSILDAAHSILNTTVLVSIIAFLVTMLISAAFASGITKPLVKLNGMVERVHKGDLSVRLESTGSDETNSIYNAFNMLIEEVNSLIKTKYVYQIRQREYELNLLYAQINPHFLYNTLDTIHVMADCGEMENVSRMITLLGDMLRYSVKNISEPVTVEQEIQHIEDYLTICTIRFGNKISYQIQKDSNMNDCQIPRLILQPIIENSLRHGMLRGKNVESILIAVTCEDNKLQFTIEDDGKGMSNEKLQQVRESLSQDISEKISNVKSSSIGLENVHNRLKLIYGEGKYLTVESSQGEYTKVCITVPMELPSHSKNNQDDRLDASDQRGEN